MANDLREQLQKMLEEEIRKEQMQLAAKEKASEAVLHQGAREPRKSRLHPLEQLQSLDRPPTEMPSEELIPPDAGENVQNSSEKEDSEDSGRVQEPLEEPQEEEKPEAEPDCQTHEVNASSESAVTIQPATPLDDKERESDGKSPIDTSEWWQTYASPESKPQPKEPAPKRKRRPWLLTVLLLLVIAVVVLLLTHMATAQFGTVGNAKAGRKVLYWPTSSVEKGQAIITTQGRLGRIVSTPGEMVFVDGGTGRLFVNTYLVEEGENVRYGDSGKKMTDAVKVPQDGYYLLDDDRTLSTGTMVFPEDILGIVIWPSAN